MMDRGWCLLLGGGVLNRGQSKEDLDLLAYPRDKKSIRGSVLDVFPVGKWSQTPVSDVYTFTYEGKVVDLIFQTWVPV